MSDVSGPTSTTRNPSPDTARIGRGSSTTDTPHNQGQSGQAQTGQQATPTGPAHDDPAVVLSSTLTHLQSGQRFAGTVIGRIPDGRLVIDSAHGVFVIDLKTSLALGPLAIKTDILLQVVNVGEDIEAAIVAMNGAHIHPPRPVVLTLADMHANALEPNVAEAIDPMPAGVASKVASTYAKPGQTNAPAADPTKAEPTKAELATSAPAAAKPEASPKSVANTASPALAKAEPAARPSVIGKILTVEPASIGGNNQVPPGTQLKLTVVAVGPEPAVAAKAPTPSLSLGALTGQATTASPAAASRPKAGVTIEATVVERQAPIPPTLSPRTTPSPASPAEEPQFLKTPFGLMRVADGPKLPDGATVTVKIEEVQTPPPPAARPARPPFDAEGLKVADLTRDWGTVTQAMKSIGIEVPPAMQGHAFVPALANAPAPTPSASLQFLLAVLRLGDVKGWLGQDAAARLDQSGNPALMAKISSDLASLTRAAHDGGNAQWRPLVVPMHDGSAIQPVAWFIRRPYDAADEGTRGGQGGGAPDTGTRFVIELDHKSLGEMQLDGLVHAKRFDLVVRSHHPLAETIRQDISGLFRTALDGAGVNGEVMFQAGRKFPLALRADMAHHAFEARPHPDRI